MRTDGRGLPIKIEVSPGQQSDYTGYAATHDEDTPAPTTVIADRGYDSDAIRKTITEAGARPVIPARRNRRTPICVDDQLYALRNRIERCFNHLKNARRVATRYDKTATSYRAFLQIVAARLWFKRLST
jgi:transposase